MNWWVRQAWYPVPRKVRFPLYFFSSIGMVGVGLTTETLSIPALLIVFFVIHYPAIIERERGRLLLRHGESFTQYCCFTPAFWPDWRLCEEPEVYVMLPRVIRRISPMHSGSSPPLLWSTPRHTSPRCPACRSSATFGSGGRPFVESAVPQGLVVVPRP
jgi:hypothetical protein